MSENPLRELAKLGRDIRMIGQTRLPIHIERSCVIFCNTKAFHSAASLTSCIRMAKFAKWANCEVFYLCDPSVTEFVDALMHFCTQVEKMSMVYIAGNKISHESIDEKASFKASNGTIGPDLVYSQIENKNETLRLVLLMDGINQPEGWDPVANDYEIPNLTIISPYPDPDQTHLQQLDLKNENIFLYSLWTFLKTKPRASLQDILPNVSKEMVDFGQKVFISCTPTANYKVPILL